MNYIEKKGTMNPKALNQWKFVPRNGQCRLPNVIRIFIPVCSISN